LRGLGQNIARRATQLHKGVGLKPCLHKLNQPLKIGSLRLAKLRTLMRI
jgi:hypothetical protein